MGAANGHEEEIQTKNGKTKGCEEEESSQAYDEAQSQKESQAYDEAQG